MGAAISAPGVGCINDRYFSLVFECGPRTREAGLRRIDGAGLRRVLGPASARRRRLGHLDPAAALGFEMRHRRVVGNLRAVAKRAPRSNRRRPAGQARRVVDRPVDGGRISDGALQSAGREPCGVERRRHPPRLDQAARRSGSQVDAACAAVDSAPDPHAGGRYQRRASARKGRRKPRARCRKKSAATPRSRWTPSATATTARNTWRR